MSQSKICVAMSVVGNREIVTDSVTEMAEKLGTSRTNISDVVNSREGRTTVKGCDGTVWVVA